MHMVGHYYERITDVGVRYDVRFLDAALVAMGMDVAMQRPYGNAVVFYRH
jgi:hypothetical protein